MSLYSLTRGTGPAMMFVHGWGMNGSVWDKIADRFTAQWQTHCVDLPGHGQSVAEEFALQTTVDELGKLAGTDAIWVGWSMGGLLALLAAQNAKPRALVLIASSPTFVRRPNWDHALKAVDFEALAIQVAADAEQALRRYLAFQLGGPQQAAKQSEFLLAVTNNTPVDGEALLRWLEVLKTTDLRDVFASLDSPVLIILGEQDPVVPVAVAKDMLQLVPGAQITTIADAAHAPFVTHPELVVETMQAFIDEL